MIIAATGHRPDKLGGYDDDVMKRLKDLARGYLEKQEVLAEVISGMAQGWDTAIALVAIELEIPLMFFGLTHTASSARRKG